MSHRESKFWTSGSREMKKFLPRKLKQNVDTGEMYSFWMMYVEQLRAGVFLIIIIIKKHAVDDSVREATKKKE